MTIFTITCAEMSEKDVALIRSLMGIVQFGQGVEWQYVEGPEADVVVVDMAGHSGRSAAKKANARAVITYADPDQTLIPNTITLTKPARARDMMDVLAQVQQKLGV